MWQLHLLNDGFPKSQQRQMSGHPGGRDSRQHDNAPYRRYPSQMNRNQRYADDAGYHQHHGHSRNTSSHPNARSNRHYDGSGSSRHHDDWGSRPGYQDSRWRRYWCHKERREGIDTCSIWQKRTWLFPPCILSGRRRSVGMLLLIFKVFLNLYTWCEFFSHLCDVSWLSHFRTTRDLYLKKAHRGQFYVMQVVFQWCSLSFRFVRYFSQKSLMFRKPVHQRPLFLTHRAPRSFSYPQLSSGLVLSNRANWLDFFYSPPNVLKWP